MSDNVISFTTFENRKKLKDLPEETLFQMRLLLLENENIDLKHPMWGVWLDQNQIEYFGDEKTSTTNKKYKGLYLVK